MKGILLLFSFFALFAANAQEEVMPIKRGSSENSWKVQWGKKTLLKSTNEDEATNVITLKRSELNKKNTFTLTYSPAADQKSGWKRTITAYDDADAELKAQKGNTFSLSSAALKALAKGHSEIKLYIISIPTDPAKAAVVRVRRVHLVTVRIV